MLHPVAHARTHPDKPAYIMAATGETVTYGELDRRANQGAHLLRALGVGRGDGIAIMLDNHPRYLEIMWAAERIGAYVTCISSKLMVDEAEYIVRDGACRVFIASTAVSCCAEQLGPRIADLARFTVGGTIDGFDGYEAARDAQPDTPVADPAHGQVMLYSSGTTGKPKGVRFPLPEEPFGEHVSPLVGLGRALYGWTSDMVYLSPAPMYHAAPLRWSMAVNQIGGTVVIMEKFDAERALVSCPLLSGPSTMTVWTKEGTTNASEEAQAGGDHRQAA